MAQTINIANIKIGMDVDELKKSGQFTRNELASLTRTMKASDPASEKLARDIALLDRAFAAGGISAKRYAEAVEHLKKKHIDASAATTQPCSGLSRFESWRYAEISEAKRELPFAIQRSIASDNAARLSSLARCMASTMRASREAKCA